VDCIDIESNSGSGCCNGAEEGILKVLEASVGWVLNGFTRPKDPTGWICVYLLKEDTVKLSCAALVSGYGHHPF